MAKTSITNLESGKIYNHMRITFYIGSLSQGGAERVIVNLASYFQSIGYEVSMVTYFKGENEYTLPQGITRYYADLTEEEQGKGRVENFARRFWKLRNLWKQLQPDVIVSFIGKTNLMTLATSRGLGIPVVVSVRSVPAREYKGRAMQLGMKVLFPFADGIVLQTKEAASYFEKSLQKKINILPNSINSSFIGRERKAGGHKEIVTVGRLDNNKNQIMLIKAFHQILLDAERMSDEISDKKELQEWRLKLYGDGPAKNKLAEYIEENEIQDYVILCGLQKDIANKIDASSIFVLPSKQEGMPNALLEAMALGLAVIATDCPCGAPAELIQDGKNGYLVPVDDVEALEKRLKELMLQQTQRERLGREAENIAVKYHPDNVNRMWKDYIEEVIRKKKHRKKETMYESKS